MTLVDELIKRQKADGLSDGQFATKLGISRPLWWQVRSGHILPSRLFLQAVTRAYPELEPELLEEIRGR